MEEHPLAKRFPDDANWALFGDSTLHGQCSVRKIPNDGASRSDMIRLLQQYQQKHVTEVRKIPWRRSPEFETGREKREHLAMFSTYQIVRVKDKSSSDGTVFRKDFTLIDEKGSIYVVAFEERPTCTCRSQFKFNCQHIMYIFRYVLDCPDPLRWQAAFLPSELEIIYRHSCAVDIIPLTNGVAQTSSCFLCFHSLSVYQKKLNCETCGRVAHSKCGDATLKVRMLKQADHCWICEDISEWNIEKYRTENQVPTTTTAGAAVTATTTTATIAPEGPTPTAHIAQQSIERKDKDEHGVGSSSSSKKQIDRETQVNDNPQVNQRPSHPSQSSSLLSSSSSNFSTPSQSTANEKELLLPPHSQQPSASKDTLPQLKGSTAAPAVSLERSTSAPPPSNSKPMRLELKQHKTQERAEKPPRGVSQDCSPALAKSLSSIPLVHYPNSNASAPRTRTPEQAGQTPVLSTDGVGSHNSAATTAAATAQTATPVSPDDIPGDVGCASPVGNTDADVHRRQAARLVRKCRRLERKSARIGKRVKRGMDKIDREYKLELMMLKKKRKIKYMIIEKKWEHDLKGLKHEREKLEEKLKDLD